MILSILGLLGLLLMLLLCMLRGMRNESPLKKRRSGLNLIALLNRYYKIEPLIYRHHRIAGLMVIIDELLLLAILRNNHWLDFCSGASSKLAGKQIWFQLAILAGWLLAILVLVIGITLVIRPSGLKGIEAWSNRWIQPFSKCLAEQPPKLMVKSISQTQAEILLLVAVITTVIAAINLI